MAKSQLTGEDLYKQVYEEACEEALYWLDKRRKWSFKRIWRKCKNPAWMLWLYTEHCGRVVPYSLEINLGEAGVNAKQLAMAIEPERLGKRFLRKTANEIRKRVKWKAVEQHLLGKR